jgi:hypothetical protein
MNRHGHVKVTSAPVQRAGMTSNLVMDVESSPLECANHLARL